MKQIKICDGQIGALERCFLSIDSRKVPVKQIGAEVLKVVRETDTERSNYSKEEVAVISAQRYLPAGCTSEQKNIFEYDSKYLFHFKNVGCRPSAVMVFHGMPGTGKSTVLKAVIRLAKALGHVVVKSCTNSRNGTGYWSRDIILAASGARRIHSSTGFTNGEIAKFRKATRRTKKCVALVIVEDISTQASSHLGLLSLACLRVTGHNNEDFGGIPTILCGDFGQVLDQLERGPCSGFVDS